MPRLIYDIDALIADWKTGKYTERGIASKYKMSPTKAHQLVSGIDKSLEPLIIKQVEINQELAEHNEQEVSKFKQEVDERTRHIKFFNSAALRNVSDAMKMPCEDQNDYRARADTINKGRETVLGKMPDTAIQVNNTPDYWQQIAERLPV